MRGWITSRPGTSLAEGSNFLRSVGGVSVALDAPSMIPAHIPPWPRWPMFKCVSAPATVGLSRGITPNLTPVGKLIIALLMHLGQAGLVIFSTAFLPVSWTPPPTVPQEEVAVQPGNLLGMKLWVFRSGQAARFPG
ncbi:MAG TPA: potassium transporter TrkG [Verrucomicrobiota bacterium]|nr:potassium transporter TrkG [Verrucomicrobiota bacterium]